MFFDKCVIDIVANIDMSGSSFDVSSANFYYPDRSGVCADGSYMIYLKFFLMGDIDKVLADLRPATAHELTHAYVDYRMNPDELMKDRSVGGLDRNFDKKFLHGAAATDDPDIKLIYNILYFTEKDEINAMQSELWSELLRGRSMIGTSAGANELLKRTEVYKRMESNAKQNTRFLQFGFPLVCPRLLADADESRRHVNPCEKPVDESRVQIYRLFSGREGHVRLYSIITDSKR